MKSNLIAIGGAIIGGIIGYFGFFWLARQGFYALALPGTMLGLGAGVVKNRSMLLAVICGIAATVLGIFTEYQFAPFIADPTLKFFLAHLHELQPFTWIMILIGGALGFYVPFRQRETA